jgi:polysaccharide export outer membrane protein
MKTKYLILLIAISLCSCSSYKKIPYFKDLDQTRPTEEVVDNYTPLTIQKTDILGINVTSRNPESATVFNYNLIRTTGSSSTDAVPGYLVDNEGFIALPLVGKMKVLGLTTFELRDKLADTLVTYYKDPVVHVRIANFKVSVIGDVQRPNVYVLTSERTTVTQALSMAGDLNITAMRKNVILIREQDGKRQFIPLDLTSKKTFESPYYYLRNNDEIYVQPDRTKYASVDRGYRAVTLIFPALSIIAAMLTIIL